MEDIISKEMLLEYLERIRDVTNAMHWDIEELVDTINKVDELPFEIDYSYISKLDRIETKLLDWRETFMALLSDFMDYEKERNG